MAARRKAPVLVMVRRCWQVGLQLEVATCAMRGCYVPAARREELYRLRKLKWMLRGGGEEGSERRGASAKRLLSEEVPPEEK